MILFRKRFLKLLYKSVDIMYHSVIEKKERSV